MSTHLGHRDNPVECVAPGDLDRAVGRVWHPTEAQAQAGNYKMAHAIVSGLPVTIETPLDRFRTGVAPDGTPWKVQMPAHYGYIKRTTGRDGDNVDVYVGPHAHIADQMPVWIVDQCDADTKAFDEHKVMIAFPDSATARNTYLAAFSDGRGHHRVGGVARLTFDAFRNWLKNGDTKKPVTMKKSASVSGVTTNYRPTTRDSSGGFMADPTAKTETSATGLGKITALITKGFAGLTGKEQAEVLAEAATLAKGETSKASEILAHQGEMRGGMHQVQDQWDGPADTHLTTAEAHGPNSSVPGGVVPVGPSQASSGNGAEKMEREYSPSTTAQYGVQRATEALGRDISGIRGAMKSVITALEHINLRMDLMKSGADVVVPDAAAIEKMIETATAKAFAGVETKIKALSRAQIAKAADEAGDDDDEDDEDASDDESSSESSKAIDDESEADDDSEKTEKSLSAAKYRLMAKSRIKWANRRLAKADELSEDNKPKTASRMARMAKGNLRKAQEYLDAALALRDGTGGPSSQLIVKAIAKAKKNAENQTTWPNKSEHAAKSGETDPKVTDKSVTIIPPGDQLAAAKALEDATDKIGKALAGMGTLTATVGDLMNSLGAASRGGSSLPPVFALAKAGAEDITSLDKRITDLVSAKSITIDDLDNSREVIKLIRNPTIPRDFVSQKMARLPQPVRDILTQAA